MAARFRGKDLTPCKYCGGRVRCLRGSEYYVRRPDLHHTRRWVCEDCGASVGCKKGTTQPLGSLADEQLRRMRLYAHKCFDPLWKDKTCTRDCAYRWLSRKMDTSKDDTHIALYDVTQCAKVIAFSLVALKRAGKHTPALPPDVKKEVRKVKSCVKALR